MNTQQYLLKLSTFSTGLRGVGTLRVYSMILSSSSLSKRVVIGNKTIQPTNQDVLGIHAQVRSNSMTFPHIYIYIHSIIHLHKFQHNSFIRM